MTEGQRVAVEEDVSDNAENSLEKLGFREENVWIFEAEVLATQLNQGALEEMQDFQFPNLDHPGALGLLPQNPFENFQAVGLCLLKSCWSYLLEQLLKFMLL